MEFYDALYKAMEDAGVSGRQVSEKMGYQYSYISSRKSMGKNSMRCDTAAKILNAFDWELVMVPKDKVPEEGIVIA